MSPGESRRVIAIIGAAGTIGRRVGAFLDEWGVGHRALDFRLEGDGFVDARDPDSVAHALDGASVCVNCADYRLNLEIMQGALAARANYVDLGGLFHMTRKQLDRNEDFRRAGLTAVLGMGSAPGKTNLLARAAVGRLAAEPRRLEIWAVTRDPAAAGHPFPAPYSVRTLVDELRMRPMIVSGGRVQDVDPLSGEAERAFPEPIGQAEGIYTLHSELATLPSAFPTLDEASFRLCLAPGLKEKLLALEDGDEPEPYVQSPESVAVHLVEVTNGNGRAVVGMTVTRGGSARSTAEPAARVAVELAEGRLSAPGVHAPEAAVDDPEAFLAKLDTEVRWQ
jgi:saccharopine dehydrogenase-like NADP-dependent oxidoreductase